MFFDETVAPELGFLAGITEYDPFKVGPFSRERLTNWTTRRPLAVFNDNVGVVIGIGARREVAGPGKTGAGECC